MKKILLIIFFLGIAVINIGKCNALSVKTLETEVNKNKLTVSGTVEKGMRAVAILIYDEDEKNLIDVRTTYVDNDNKYEETIKIDKDEKYVVKVADYDGGRYMETKINEEDEVLTATVNPDTSDNIKLYLSLLLISSLLLIGIRMKDIKGC